jgi:Fic family protein
VGVHLPTANYLRVPELVSTIFSQSVRRNTDMVKLSARIHSKFEQIHPFSDGNGRVGRLLMNAMLLKANFTPAIIRQERKRLYYTYLFKAQTTDDHSQLEDFLCDTIVDGFKILERIETR